MNQLWKTLLGRNATVLALLVGGVVFFAGCKKDISSEKFDANNTAGSVSGSETVSAEATILNEGFGSQAVGGANSSTTYHVTNLNSSGSGSLSGGIGSNKTIVFDVSGTISGTFDLMNISYLTIDGSGRDITINGGGSNDVISFDGANTNHCILKNIHVTNGQDGINCVSGAHDILITNCTSSKNLDGNIDVAADNSGQTKNITVQYCILGDDQGPGNMLVTGQNVSVHHNLFIGTGGGEPGERNPYCHANYSPVGSPNVDFRNNVVYTTSRYASGIGYKATGNFVNNYYVATGGLDPNADPAGNTASYYVAGNQIAGGANINLSGGNHAAYAITSTAAVTTQDACTAASMVLNNAGPTTRNSSDNSYIGKVTLSGCSGGTTTNQNPTANAGADKAITLPTSSLTLSGSGSDPDGTIASYAWSKVSGTGGIISATTSASTMVSALAAGTYTFRLTVTDNKGATGSDDVVVTVNSATSTNIPPTVSAGSAQTITLPVSSVTLNGSASDPDGSIASYAWTKISGTGGTITSPSAASTTVSGLTAGAYVFSLKVTDNKGAASTATVAVTVNSATQTGGGTGYTLAFAEGYDAASSINTNQGQRNAWTSSPVNSGAGSFKSEVRAGDATVSGGFRSEMVYNTTAQNPTEGAVEYNEYFQNWSGLDGGGTNIAWNPSTSGAGSIVSLQNYGGKLDVVRAIGSTVTHQSGLLMSILSNTWYKLRWEYKWSTGSDGYVRLYVNGILYYSYTGQTSDGSTISFRVGQNRWPNSGNSMTTTSICYYDNVNIYKKG